MPFFPLAMSQGATNSACHTGWHAHGTAAIAPPCHRRSTFNSHQKLARTCPEPTGTGPEPDEKGPPNNFFCPSMPIPPLAVAHLGVSYLGYSIFLGCYLGVRYLVGILFGRWFESIPEFLLVLNLVAFFEESMFWWHFLSVQFLFAILLKLKAFRFLGILGEITPRGLRCRTPKCDRREENFLKKSRRKEMQKKEIKKS